MRRVGAAERARRSRRDTTMNSLGYSVEKPDRGFDQGDARARLRVVEPSARTEAPSDGRETIQLKLEFRELVMIHRALEGVKNYGVIARQDTLLDDLIDQVDTVLKDAV